MSITSVSFWFKLRWGLAFLSPVRTIHAGHIHTIRSQKPSWWSDSMNSKGSQQLFYLFFFFFSGFVAGAQTQTAMQMRFTWMTSNDLRVVALVQAAEKEKPCISTESQHKSKCIFVRLLWSPSYFSCWVIYGGLGHAGQRDGWHVTKGWGRIHTYRAPSTLNISYTQVKHSNAPEANK